MSGAWDALRERTRPDGDFATRAYLARPKPVRTGLNPLDEATGGLARGLVCVGGEPGVGKSALACNVATLLCCTGYRVIYASYEMTHDDVHTRCASCWSSYRSIRERFGIEMFSWSDVTSGRAREARAEYDGLDRYQLSRVAFEGGDPIARALSVWDDKPGRNLVVIDDDTPIGKVCDLASEVAGEYEDTALVIDYLQIAPSGGTREVSEYERVTSVANRLLSYAKGGSSGRLVIAISSTRNINDTDRRDGPSLTWLRGSGYLGYNASQVLMLVGETEGDGRPSVNADGSKNARLHVLKNRVGKSGTSKLVHLRGQLCRFVGAEAT